MRFTATAMVSKQQGIEKFVVSNIPQPIYNWSHEFPSEEDKWQKVEDKYFVYSNGTRHDLIPFAGSR